MGGVGPADLRRLDRRPARSRHLRDVLLDPVPRRYGAAGPVDHRVHRAPAAGHLERRPLPAYQGDRPLLRPGPATLPLHRSGQRREGVSGHSRRCPQAPHAVHCRRRGAGAQRLYRPQPLGTFRHRIRPHRLRHHHGRLRRLVGHRLQRPGVHADHRISQGRRPRHHPCGRGEEFPRHLLRGRIPQGLRRRSSDLRRRRGGGRPGGAHQLPVELRRRRVPPGLLRCGRRPDDHRRLRRRGLPRRCRPGPDHPGQEAHLRPHHICPTATPSSSSGRPPASPVPASSPAR